MPFSEAPFGSPFDSSEAKIELSPEVQPHPPAVVSAKEEQPSQKVEKERETLAELNEKIRLDPKNTSLLRKLAVRLYETGKPQESERQYLKALELEPQSVENHLALAEFYTRLGLKIKAFKHLNIILQLQPTHERALEMMNIKKASKKPLYEISEN